MVELKTHAAQLGWNTCNPSLLSRFAFCWHIYFKRPPFFNSSAWLAHSHKPMNQHIHVRTSHVRPIHTLSTIRHYSFPLAVHPVNCYVVCYMDSLIRFVHLNFFFLCLSVTLAYYTTLFPNYLYSDRCVTGLCVVYIVV